MSYQKNFDKLLAGEFIDRCCNFYDWFCSESSIQNKAISLTKKVKFLVDQKIINPETTYVWFKNNCPCDGKLYDDMRFSTSDNENLYLGGIAPSLGYNTPEYKGKCNVFLRENGFDDMLFANWSEFKKQVKTNPEFKSMLTKALWR